MDSDHSRTAPTGTASGLPDTTAQVVSSLGVELYLDTADIDVCRQLGADPLVSGFTTNTTLMKKAGVRDYRDFAARLIEIAENRPVSFGVLADELSEMERQARRIASWGSNVFAKIPVTDSRGTTSADVVRRLSGDGVRVNVTAVLTADQFSPVLDALDGGQESIVSFFAGRVADTGLDPLGPLHSLRKLLGEVPRCRLLWGSTRELYNVFQADRAGCDVITVPPEVFAKTRLVAKGLDEMCRETVRSFGDAASGYSL